jgi:heterodisulfide reductase subunit C
MDLQLDKFGFSLMTSREVSLDDAHVKGFQSFLIAKEPTVTQCMQCGSCVASCTTSKANTQMRSAIHFWMRGMVDEARKATSNCLFCGKCRFVCPRGVNGRNVLAIIHKK